MNILITALCASLALIAFTACYWEIIDVVTPFLILPLTGIIWGVFIATFICSLLHLSRKQRFKTLGAYTPLAIQILSTVIVLTVPFTFIMLHLDFRSHLKQREEVVSAVLSGELKPNVGHNSQLIMLPKGYRHLSKSGQIAVERSGPETYVFFYTFRGILDNFSGFMYRSDDTLPQDGDFAGRFIEINKLRDKWYWTAAN